MLFTADPQKYLWEVRGSNFRAWHSLESTKNNFSFLAYLVIILKNYEDNLLCLQNLGRISENIRNFLTTFWNFLLTSSAKISDVPSWLTYQPTLSDCSPIMLNLPTYLKSDVINGRSLNVRIMSFRQGIEWRI